MIIMGRKSRHVTQRLMATDGFGARVGAGALGLQEAGGWNRLAMPRRYVEESEIANDGMA
jgi:hypothetical protein